MKSLNIFYKAENLWMRSTVTNLIHKSVTPVPYPFIQGWLPFILFQDARYSKVARIVKRPSLVEAAEGEASSSPATQKTWWCFPAVWKKPGRGRQWNVSPTQKWARMCVPRRGLTKGRFFQRAVPGFSWLGKTYSLPLCSSTEENAMCRGNTPRCVLSILFKTLMVPGCLWCLGLCLFPCVFKRKGILKYHKE